MQVRVIHLSNLYNNLQRDKEEIQRLQNNLNENRSYSANLFNSLQLEKENIFALQEKLLLQVVKDAPNYLYDEFSTNKLKEKEEGYQAQNSQTQKTQNISQAKLISKDKNEKTQNIAQTKAIPKDKNSTKEKFSFAFKLNKS